MLCTWIQRKSDELQKRRNADMTDDAAVSSYSWQHFKKAYCHTVEIETECRNNKGKCGGKSEKHFPSMQRCSDKYEFKMNTALLH